MFEDTNFDLDDDAILGTSFTPAVTSTQSCSPQKRLSQEIHRDNFKKLKLSNDEQRSFSNGDDSDTSPKQSGRGIESLVTTPNTNRIVKRRFPGPAGLLPQLSNNKSTLDCISDKSYGSDDSQDHMLLCSQQTVSVFKDGPWKEMVKDYNVPGGESLYYKFNISWIKKQATLKKLLVNNKAPFLAAVIQSLEIFDGRVPTVNVTLKDATGDIQGTVLHSLYEEHSDYLTTGSVLVLKQFGVLSAGFNSHCLMITPNNLVAIYCLDVPGKPPSDGSNQISLVKRVVIQNCSVDEIMTKYKEDVLACQRKKNSSENPLWNDSGSRSVFGSNKLRRGSSNDNVKKNNVVLPALKNSFNKTGSENNIKSVSKIVTSDNGLKKRFNFKGSSCLKSRLLDSSGKFEDSIALMGCQKLGSSDNCDIVVSSSQSLLSVRTDNKEHSEIWKDLLDDVDADSLFDDF